MIAAYIDTKNTKTNGISTGQTGRLVRSKIITRIDMVKAANSWFVVPNSGQMIMPPRPSPPAENARPNPVTSVNKVATKTRSLIPNNPNISDEPKRGERPDVSNAIAGNSTARDDDVVGPRLS